MPPKVSLEYKEDTRERILGAAQGLFQQKGYHETSMDDIVKVSGLSKGAIYGYFESKEELFETIQDREYLRTYEEAKKVLETEGNATSRLEKVADLYFVTRDELARVACRMALEFSSASLTMKPVRKKIEERYKQTHDLLASLLKEGVKNEEFRKGIDVDSIAWLLVATVDGLMQRWAITEAEIDWKSEKEAMVNVVLEGISAHRIR